MNLCPWRDFAGNEIYDGDVISHPTGARGKVVFLADKPDTHAQWRVDYGDGGPFSSLGLQIGDKGQAVVIERATSPTSGEWEKEGRLTLDKLAAFLQCKNVPYAVNWRDWIDNAVRVLDAYSPVKTPAQPETTAPRVVRWDYGDGSCGCSGAARPESVGTPPAFCGHGNALRWLQAKTSDECRHLPAQAAWCPKCSAPKALLKLESTGGKDLSFSWDDDGELIVNINDPEHHDYTDFILSVPDIQKLRVWLNSCDCAASRVLHERTCSSRKEV